MIEAKERESVVFVRLCRSAYYGSVVQAGFLFLEEVMNRGNAP